MSFTSLLINAITVRRYVPGAVDAYGNPTKAWADHLTTNGRLSYPKGRQIQRGTEVVPVDAVLFMSPADVTEADIVWVSCFLFFGKTYEILFVAELQNGTADHHLELSLARVKP